MFRLSPGLGLRVAEHRADHLYRRSRRRRVNSLPTAEEWAGLFGADGLPEPDELARSFLTASCRLSLIQHIAAQGQLSDIAPLVKWKNPERLEQLCNAGEAAIITTAHAGPTIGIWAALTQMEVNVVRVQEKARDHAPAGWAMVSKKDSGGGTAVLKRCLRHLRAGGWVGIPFDSFSTDPGHYRVRLLDRWIPLPRGPVALSEMSGAPLIPVSPRWSEDGRSIELTVQEPLDTARRADESDEVFETRVLQSAVNGLEQYLRRSPHEYNRLRLQYVLRQPTCRPHAGR